MSEVKKRRFRSAYDGVVLGNGINTGSVSMVQQHLADACDVNLIIKRFATKGEQPIFAKSNLRYGEFHQVGSYHEALDIVREAEEMFASLPAKVRQRFANDPEQMMEFVNDSANYDEAVKLGLIEGRESSSERVIMEPGVIPEGDENAGKQAKP